MTKGSVARSVHFRVFLDESNSLETFIIRVNTKLWFLANYEMANFLTER